MKRTLLILLFLSFGIHLNAQSWVKLKSTDDIKVFYKLKKQKNGKEEIRIKMINRSKSDLNVDLEMGFYDTGVLEQKAEIHDCLKKGFFSNLFRVGHLINGKTQESDGKFSQYKIQLLELNTKKVDKCEIMEP